MAIASTAIFRIRVGGSDTNGGGYDPSIVGGIDYTDQDVAINVYIILFHKYI